MTGRNRLPAVIGVLFAVIVLTVSLGARADALPELRHGDRLFNQGEFRAAFDHYLAAYRLGQAAGDKLLMGEALTNMAAIHIELNDHARFKQAYDQAQQLKRSHARQNPDIVPISDPLAAGNILGSGGFEEGLFYPWGIGHYEREEGKFKFGIWWNSNNARAYMKIDTVVKRAGNQALRITNFSPAAPHVFTTTSQRIEGLRPNTLLRFSMFVKARDLEPGAVTFTVDAGWTKRLPSLKPGTYDWQPYVATINIGHNDYIDFRIIHQSLGTVWIDDLVIERVEEGEPSDPIQLAESLFDLARYDDALEIYHKIEQDYPADSGIRIMARLMTGRIHMTLGSYDEALASFSWVLDRGWRRTHWDLGDLHLELGEYLKAIVHYEKALDAVKGDQSSESLVLNRLGEARMAQSRTTKSGPRAGALMAGAKRALERSLTIVRHIGDRHGEVKTLLSLGAVRQAQGDQTSAIKLFGLAAKKVSGLGDRKLYSDVLLRLAEASLQNDEIANASRLSSESRTIKAEIGDGLGLVQSLSLLGRVKTAQGDRHGARVVFKEAIDLLEGLYESLATAPRETRQVFLTQFQDLYRWYIGLLFELYNQDPKPGFQKAAFEMGEQVRSRVFSEMVAETRAASSLVSSAKDPAFSRLLRRERDNLVRLQALRFALMHESEASPAQHDGVRIAALEDEILAAERDYSAALSELERGYPRYFELRRPKRLTSEDVQGLLSDHEAVLSYLVTAESTGLWVISKQKITFAVVPLGQRELARQTLGFSDAFAEMIRRFGDLFEPDHEDFAELFGLYDPAVAHRLYVSLVQPVAAALKGKSLVYLAPDDVLYKLPFDALLTAPVNSHSAKPTAMIAGDLSTAPFLVRDVTLAYLPSVSVLRTLRTLPKPRVDRQEVFVAFADPIFDETDDVTPSNAIVRGFLMRRFEAIGSFRSGGLGRLPDTRAEALHIARVLGVAPERSVFLGRDASESNVKRLPLSNFRYILFATHGLLAGEFKPGVQPALALSFVGDTENDGLLEMSEVLGLDLAADLVALSACNTAGGGGDSDRGEGFAGLTRSFMYAGARSLLVTQWPVETSTARELMQRVFQGALDDSVSQSLVQAKRALLESPRPIALEGGVQVSTAHPLFWAPFILVGEGR